MAATLATAFSSTFVYGMERTMIQVFPDRWMKLWNEWEIRALVLISLSLQVMLIGLGKQRKHDRRKRIRYTLWLAYLSADAVATLSLGILSSDQGESKLDSGHILKALWAPILLLHLGGPDTITAYSMEDNALWLRHLLGLSVQTAVAAYVIIKSLKPTQLNYVAAPMFVSGIIKYGERTWALRSASNDQFRRALLPKPDPGPNYAKFMEEYNLRETEGYKLKWSKIKDPKMVVPSLISEGGKECSLEAAIIPKTAYDYFQTHKRLFADLILSFQELEKSKSFFLHNGWKKAFQVTEAELAFTFDSLFTKSAMLYSRWGRMFRAVTIFSTILTLAGFYISPKYGCHKFDVIITYLLLIGATALDIIATLVWLYSDWAVIWLAHHDRMTVKNLYKAMSFFRFGTRKKWSNVMIQYNLIAHCFEQNPRKSFVSHPCYWHQMIKMKIKADPAAPVPDYFKRYIFEHLLEHTSDLREDRTFCSYRGAWTLEEYECSDLSWSIDKEFDRSILLWHIATDLCYYTDLEAYLPPQEECELSRLMSNYMLYLLVKRPLMLPSGIGQIRYQDTCAEARCFIEERSIQDDKTACRRLLNIKTKIRPGDIKGDRSKSVLFDACRLAKLLQNKQFKWQIIVGVWVEMLGFAANQCRSNYHAQQLAQGGEFLTHVWLLLAHLGLSEHFQISEGHFRVVLDVT